MIRSFLLLIIFAVGFAGIFLRSSLDPKLNSITGVAEIIDSDGLYVTASNGHIEEIRLYGIDGPEWSQTCYDTYGVEYACGRDAAIKLQSELNGKTVKCKGQSRDRYGRLVAICKHNSADIAERLVREGRAWAWSRYSKKYILAEWKARSNMSGYWNGNWQAPWVYRRKQKGYLPKSMKESGE